MKRRDFHKTLIAATALPSPKSFKTSKKLKVGDRVGLIAPASKIDETRLQKAVKNMESIGLQVFYDPKILETQGYLGGSDQHRVDQLHAMYADKKIDAIWCVRGGYGATRLLDQIDFELIRSNPKPLLGYSDITALLNTIHEKTNSPCFHAPVASSTFSKYTIDQLAPIWGLKEQYELRPSIENQQNKDEAFRYYPIIEGTGEGRLVGGNLSLIVSLLGTAHALNTRGKIVFIEDIGEHCYRIDRMLTQLLSAGFFDGVQGILFGVFEDCTPEREGTQTLKEVLTDRLKPLGIPCAYGFSFGHIRHQMTLPIGAEVLINTQNGRILLQNDGY